MPSMLAVDIGGTFTDLVAYDLDPERLTYTKSLTTYDDLALGIFDCIRKAGIDDARRAVRQARHHACHQRVAAAQRRQDRSADDARVSATCWRSGAATARIRSISASAAIRRSIAADLRFEVDGAHRRRQATSVTPLDTGGARRARRHIPVRSGSKLWRSRSSIPTSTRRMSSSRPTHLRTPAAGRLFVTRVGAVARMVRVRAHARRRPPTPMSGRRSRTYIDNSTTTCARDGFTGSLLLMGSHGGVSSVDARCASRSRWSNPGRSAAASAPPLLAKSLELRQRHRLRHGRHDREMRAGRERRVHGRIRSTMSAASTPAFRCAAMSSTSSRSAPAAARSPGSTSSGACMSGRAAPARRRGRSATAKAAREPTVTDANLVLGRLNPRRFLGGEMTARPEPARDAHRSERIGRPARL